MSKRPDAKSLLLVFSQVFVPDPASVGQHMTDVAIEMARRGHRVRVYASARGYDDPTLVYPARENLSGVDVRRLPLASFGKKSILARVLGTFAFQFQVLLRGMCTPNVAGIFFSTSPPLIGAIAAIIGCIRGIPIVYWAMDLNPDQLIALGKLKPGDKTARFLESVNRWILKRSALTVALDRFMAERLARRANLNGKLMVLPPWSPENHLHTLAAGENPFIAENKLAEKFVIMYSGNHSPSNPLDTLLHAARHFQDDQTLRFVFVGGGIGKRAVEQFVAEHQLANVLCLPYQPLEKLGFSLSAANVHVVSLGDAMAGIIHPCKIYGAMAAGKPILYLGPRPSHITDILDQHAIGWHIPHGDVALAIQTIDTIRKLDVPDLAKMGQTGQAVLNQFSQEKLCGQFCDGLETAMRFKRDG